jgi:hypothetical protein
MGDKQMRKILSCFIGATLLLLVAGRADATVITAFEEIGDATCVDAATCTDSLVDLYRIRDLSGVDTTENTDSIIIADNSVSSSFGLDNVLANGVVGDVTFTHLLTWLPTSTFTGATLTISGYDNQGNNTIALAEQTIDLGTLNFGKNLFTDTTFDLGSILVQLNDQSLGVMINKSNQDESNIFKSRLTVSYEDDVAGLPNPPSAVPEPASMSLLGTGLVALATGLRRRIFS